MGAELRADLAAFVASFGLRGIEVRLGDDERARGIPVVVRCEVDEAVDDLEVRFVGGHRVLVQVKRHLDFDLRPGYPLTKVIDQWVDQCSTSATDKTPLVAVVQSASTSVRHLADALDRRRDPYAGALTLRQESVLKELSAALIQRGPGVVDEVLERASIAIIDVSAGRGDAVPIGLLDGIVVAVGQGPTAFDALAGAYRRRAARRTGLDLDGWIEVLRKAQLDVVADADGCRSARRAAEQAALSRHRHRLIAEGQTVNLLTLGTALPPIPAVPLTRVTNDPTDADGSQQSTELDQVLRRHGRVLLLGQPGAGKSTMLRRLTAREAERGWSTPVFVDLRALLAPTSCGRPLRLDGSIDPLDTLVELATAATPLKDRDLLAGAVRRAAEEGSLLVCLDSLDETRDHRPMVVSWLRRLLERLDAGCDLVLATRASAYAQAATLGWQQRWVAPPEQIEPVVVEVLEAFARWYRRDRDWVQTRLRWVLDRAAQVPRLAETPLLLTALAIDAAERDSLDEVTGPAHLLERTTGWVASNWESRSDRIGAELPPGLPALQVADALRTALGLLAWTVVSHAESPRAEAIQAELTAGYMTEHGLAPGVARVLAKAAVHFWDEAGIVVLDRYGCLSSLARPVVEVAAARYVAGLSSTDRTIAITHLAAESTTFEVLSLLASLDGSAADEVVDVAVDRTDRDLLIAVASGLQSSAEVSPAAVGRLVDALGALPASGEADQATIVRYLVDLPAPPTERNRILAVIKAKLPATTAFVWQALLQQRWGDPTAEATCRAATLAGLPPTPPPPPHLTRTQAMLFPNETAGAFGEVILATTGWLRAGEEDMAEHIRQVAYHFCPSKSWKAVRHELGQRGFRNDPPTEQREHPEKTVGLSRKIFETTFGWLLEHLAQQDQPHHLRVVERRRLEHLSRLIEGLAISRLETGVFEVAVQQHQDDVIAVVEVFLSQGGFDRSMIAAEAASFLAEFRDDRYAWLYLAYDPPKCRFSWNDDISEVIAPTARLFGKSYWLAYLAFTVLVQVLDSDQPAAAAAAAAQAEARIPARQQRFAALTALYMNPTRYIPRWRHTADPILVATVMERASADADRLALLVEGLGHPNALVRDKAADQITTTDAANPAVAEALHHALDLPDQGTCRYCGESFINRSSNCGNCGLSLPNPRSKIDGLLSPRLEEA
ncbi:NACHT domain-containing protein [Streptosporangium lutulentum]|uniref:NACHT domain-containing protein n=1 Tax=Streptosporangium lutulentum TaxID=1461250 RepID=A0ABT9QV30_9ACTN|nr:hypothetical protein [Streptosporangium lutulentum]MDP9850280.1 hypothetical protein [Streptosporangium lutulentum]